VFALVCPAYVGAVPKAITGKLLIARLRELRKRHSVSQEQCSELAGISYKYYQLIESGKRIDLRLSTLQKLARAYGIQVHELLAPEMPETRLPRRVPSKRRGRPPH
jgi:transcriptional regulator with XRE-family HTH domain